jgi:HTH-type transcriptional regulator / antitoxin HipB
MNAKQLGASVREARQAHQLTHKAVARAANVSVQFLVDLEQGKPTIQLDKALATAFFLGINLTPGIDEHARNRLARFAAVEKKAIADAKMYDFHQAIVTKLRENPSSRDSIISKALTQVDRWEHDSLCSPVYISRWRSALRGGADGIQAKVLNDPVWMKALIQNSPFGFLVRKKARLA